MKLLCSLCGSTKEARPLDLDDLLFGNYVRTIRKLGLSRHTGKLGVCAACMKNYNRMLAEYRKKQVLFLVAGLLLAALYFTFTQNIIASLIVLLFVAALSLVSYCPPLKEGKVKKR